MVPTKANRVAVHARSPNVYAGEVHIRPTDDLQTTYGRLAVSLALRQTWDALKFGVGMGSGVCGSRVILPRINAGASAICG